jgi:hypothetical protein
MWKIFKAMPLVPKILIICVVFALIYKVSHPHHSHYYSPDPVSPAPAAYHSQNQSSRSGSQSESESGGSNQLLAQFQSQQSQLLVRVRQCQGEMTQATNQQAAAAMQGRMSNYRPACEGYMPQWIAQEAYLETEIYRIQTGDRTTSMRNVVGIPADSGSSSQSSYSTRDDGTAAVERFSREAIRGNSYYDSPNQEPGDRERPNADYYYRNRATGQVTPSTSPYAPNDGNDYERLTYSPQ